MKQKIIIELDKMISNGENVTYRELGKRLGTVASTITYQFGSKDKLIEYYLDYKFTNAYQSETFDDFTELLIFSYKTNKNLLGTLSNEITVESLVNIQTTLLTKHFESFQQLYKKQFGRKNDLVMVQQMSLIQLMALNPVYYSQVLNFDCSKAESVEDFIRQLTIKDDPCNN